MPDDTTEDATESFHASTGQRSSLVVASLSPNEGSDSEKTQMSPITENPSEQQKQQKANILSNLHKEPASVSLQAFFRRLAEGSSTWDIDTFIEGLRCFANLTGPKRVQYYGDKPLQGLLYPNLFTKRWNKGYPRDPITVWDQDIRRAAPPGWSYGLNKEQRSVLTYEGEAPLGQGINDLLRGPTTLDCGMWQQLALWIGIRYLLGDSNFHLFFNFKKRQFTLTQDWDREMDADGTTGNLLHPFYDHATTAEFLGLQTRIQAKAVFNHPKYLAKHPGGEARLQNVTRVDDYYIIFNPEARRGFLSEEELEQSLLLRYNDPQDLADAEKLWLYTKLLPEYVHPDYAPKTCRTLAEEAEEYANHTLGEDQWRDSQIERERNACGLHFTFNFERLVSCLEEARATGGTGEDILSLGRLKQRTDRGMLVARLLGRREYE